jgi:hypothetical protein
MSLQGMVTRLLAATALLTMASCSSGGINAGEIGGVAFIAFTGMLLVSLGILYLFIGRGD